MPGTFIEVYPDETDVPHLPPERLVNDLQEWVNREGIGA